MNAISFETSRCRDGYRIVLRPPGKKGGRRPYYLVATSDRFERLAPLDNFPALFAILADTPANPEGLRKFADNFGLLDSGTATNATKQSVPNMLHHQWVLKRALAAFEKEDNHELMRLLAEGKKEGSHSSLTITLPGAAVGLAQVELRMEAGNKLEAVIVPSSLIQAIWTQFLLHAASNAQLLRCEHCAKPFVVGSGTNRRSTAKYCSNACKVAAFKARQEA